MTKNGFVLPTPVQAGAIPPALAGKDVVATAQTGTGKTLAFVLPILESLTHEPRPSGVSAVVLSPTRELAIQIHEAFMQMAAGTGIRSAIVVGGLNENSQLQAIRKGAQVVIATPGRLCDFLQRRLVKLTGVRILILDEGDRMLDMGFLPAIQAIIQSMPAERQTMFFSATIEPSITKLIQTHLKNPVRVAVGSITKPAEQVDLHMYEVEKDGKIDLLHYMLSKEQGSYLIFVRTKHNADRLAKRLSADGVKTARIHGDRTQAQRNQALKGFQDGEYRVLVATDVAARGIHVEGIAHVINFELPQQPEDFIHRVGRTGRAGARGTATTFYLPSERNDIRLIERKLKVQLEKRHVSPDAMREHKKTMPVVTIPFFAAHKPAGRPSGKPHHASSSAPEPFWFKKGKKSFGPSSKRKRA
ncbi:MAG: DEAD/DEAH box helicase [Acidobacteriia bacterium]|nr:DEAD/DEAH box helicase [Terriglobia bacterium]